MKSLKQKGKDIVWVVAGNAVLALAVSMFILPYDILSGGVAGVAVALQPLIPLPVTLMVNLLVVGFVYRRSLFSGKDIRDEDHFEFVDLSGISDVFQWPGAGAGS